MIICDSNILVALSDSSDPLRRRAQRDLAKLISKEFFITEAILCESIYLLPTKMQRARLAALLTYLEIRLTPALNESALLVEAFEWMAKYADHEPDWADAHIAVLCQHDRNYQVWTYDSEFKSIWRRPDGTAIPCLSS